MSKKRVIPLLLLCLVLAISLETSYAAPTESRVSQSTDDAEEALSDGSVDANSSDLEMIFNGENQEVGMRFQNININQGAIIATAYITFTVKGTDDGATSLIFHGEDNDNAVTFAEVNYDISKRENTTAFVNWSNIPAWDTVDEEKITPDLTPIIQEIIDRPGWVSGNSIVIKVTGSGDRTAYSWDGVAGSAPLLTINLPQWQTIESWDATVTAVFPGTIIHTPSIVLPREVFYITSCITAESNGLENITAVLHTSDNTTITGFIFLDEYGDNDNAVEDCPIGYTASASWMVAAPYDVGSYQMFAEWGWFTNSTNHMDNTDNYEIEVGYFTVSTMALGELERDFIIIFLIILNILMMTIVKIPALQIFLAVCSGIVGALLQGTSAFPWLNTLLVVTAIYAIINAYNSIGEG